MRDLLSIYSYRFPSSLVYMMQSCEYQSGPYLRWLWRTKDYSSVQHRRKLDKTSYAKVLLAGLSLGMLLEIAIGIALIIYSLTAHIDGLWEIGLAIVIAYPLLWSHLIILPLELGKSLIVEPKQKQQIAKAQAIFANHSGVKIAVAGSYGKTSMKEVLKTVLSEARTVAATEGNLNVAVAQAKFATKLNGREEILIIEYGESGPGDVARFASISQPNYAVITGIAPAHLNNYKTLDAAANDIFSLASYLKNRNVYVNGESKSVSKYLKPEFIVYGVKGIDGWSVKNVKITVSGTSFNLVKAKKTLHITSQLLGRQQIGVLAASAVIAMKLGLSEAEVESGIAKTKPYEHRMQPYTLSGATIIDDTYNGNIEGIRAGVGLLSELSAKRKIYVSPGLVEQGIETKAVHLEMGRLIAQAKPDLVVLMDNSVSRFIKQGLSEDGFKGELRLEKDPLAFYQGLEHFVAAGDLVLMQNDWTDNYA